MGLKGALFLWNLNPEINTDFNGDPATVVHSEEMV
jgi:hypothetical protein